MQQMFDALYAAGHKPFDLAVERLIAFLRVSLTLFSLIAFATSPWPQLLGRENFELILAAYAVFGLGVALLPTLGGLRTGWQLPVHLIDIGVISVLMYFLQTLSSTFFILYVFVLLSATSRWNWRGALWTTVFVFGLQVIMFLAAGTVVQFTLQSAFLFIIGGMFAFFGAGRERSADRLNQIAAWPSNRAQSYTDTDNNWLDASLTHVATVLEVPRILLLWEITQEPYLFTALFADGKCQQARTTAVRISNLVSAQLENLTFASEAAESKECITSAGTKHEIDPIVNNSLHSLFKISSVCSAPFAGEFCRGRVFMLDRAGWGEDDLALAEVVASRLLFELEHDALCVRLEETAASRERVRLARDLHDSVLQSLAAAGLQLKLIASRLEQNVQLELGNVRKLLSDEQQRIRKFVERRQPQPAEQPINLHDELQRETETIEHRWGCRILLQSASTKDVMVSPELARQIKFVLAEAVANAVQHGNASRVNISVKQTPNEIQLQIRDNGVGLSGANGNYNQKEIATLGIGPQSISKRVTELRGRLALSSSPRGVELHIELARDGAATNRTKYVAHALG